jgi:tetratricopeptide (TPR) repeat protein
MRLVILNESRNVRLAAADAREADYGGRSRLVLDGAALPFTRLDHLTLPRAPRLVRIDDIELAFPDRQTGGVRLILTQPTYLLQKLIDRLAPEDVLIATADRGALQRVAPEALLGTGAWRRFVAEDRIEHGIKDTEETKDTKVEQAASVSFMSLLRSAFTRESPGDRAALCREAAHAAPSSEVAALCLASACREIGDVKGARSALDSVLQLASDWEAAHFEDGKFWLAADDMSRARDAFARAATLMPTFSAAFSNLGATLGELDDAEGAAEAFHHALEQDPDNVTLLNNIGVVERERGRLESSEEALTRVTTLVPGFVFGHYNLGHTRFLRGDFAGALEAYEKGWRLDSQKNRRQGCRLALVRFANGRVETAERDFWELVDSAPLDEREDLLLEAYEVGTALLEAHPQLALNRRFVDRIAAALTL